MSFAQVFRILWARRAIVLTAVLGCLIGALIVIKLVPPRYEATSRVMMDIVKPDPVTGEVIASQFARAYVKTQIELIRDYRIAGKVTDALGWTNSPAMAAAYARRPPSDNRDFRRWLAQRIIDGTTANLIEGSNILEIHYSSSSPATAAKVADAIRQAYVDQMLAFKRQDAAQNAQWFRQQAERIRNELTAAQKRKSDFERANGVVLQDDNSDTETARLKALATAPPPQAVSAPAPVTVGAPSGKSAQLAQADAAIAAASKVLGPNNPELQNLKRQRDALAASAAASGPVVRRGAAVSTGPSIGALYSQQEAKVLAQRGKVAEAQQLAADVAVLRDQYNKSAAKAGELEQVGETTETGLTLLGSAVAPQSPAFPNKPLLVFGSIALGAALGIVLSLFVELLRRRVRGPEDIASSELPVIGMMAKNRHRQRFAERLGFRPRRLKLA